MQNSRRSFALSPWLALTATLALAGCGGDGTSSDSTGGAQSRAIQTPTAPPPALAPLPTPNTNSSQDQSPDRRPPITVPEKPRPSLLTAAPPLVAANPPPAAPTAQTLPQLEAADYAKSVILIASNYGIAPGNAATVNDAGFAALHTAMIASPGTIWHIVFSPGAYTYTNNRWLWGVQNVIIDAWGTSFQCTSTSSFTANAQALWTADFFNDSGDVPFSSSANYVDGYLINTANVGATQVTATTAANAGKFAPGDQVLVYGYDQQGSGYPPNMRYFDYMTVATVNSSTGVITFANATNAGPLKFSSQLKNFYDSRWKDTADYFGSGSPNYGAPRILNLQRPNYSIPQLIWIRGATFLNGLNNTSAFGIEVTAQIVILEFVNGAAFNIGQSNQGFVRNSAFYGEESSGDKMVNSLLVQDTVINPEPNATSSLTDCVGCNNLYVIRDTLYGQMRVSPRNLNVEGTTIIPISTQRAGIITGGSNPIWNLNIGNTNVYNTGTLGFGVTAHAAPGNSLTVGSVSGTNIQLSYSQTVADWVDYGMTLTDSATGNSGVITGIYDSSGTLVLTGTWGTPTVGHIYSAYDVINKYDQGGNVIVGTQVPFWRAPPSLPIGSPVTDTNLFY
jgi:hypothetical protein